jgi:hypothetical protein
MSAIFIQGISLADFSSRVRAAEHDINSLVDLFHGKRVAISRTANSAAEEVRSE